MKTHEHLLINLVVSAISLYLSHSFTYLNLVLMVAGGVVFDLDHILYFILTYKTFSLNKMMRWSLKEYHGMKTKIYVFHTLDFIVLLGIIAYFDRRLVYLFAGFIIHCICDWARAGYHFKNDWMGFVNWSKYWLLIWNLKQNLPAPALEE
jgi:hypothetical protein